jgi:tetratricopeptide (TPR) repeat protein
MPTNPVAFNYLGLALHQAGQPAEAERAYLRALTLNHDLTEAHYNLGCLWLLQSNRLEQARSELITYTLRMPNVPEGWSKLGEVQLRSRDAAAAEKSLGEALRLDPHNPEALNALGLARLNRKRPNEAAQLFAKANKEQPEYAPALLNLAVVAQQDLNDPKLAIQKYREYLALKPPPEEAQAVKAVINKLEQDLAAAAVPPTSTNTTVQPPSHTNVLKTLAPEVAVSNTAPRPPANTGQLVAAQKPEPQNIVPKSPVPATTANQPKAAPPANTNPTPAGHLEVVKLAAEPVIKPAEDIATAPQPAEPADSAAPTPADSRSLSTDTKPTKRGFFHKINPINLFTHDGKSSESTGPTYAAVNEKPSPSPAARSAAPTEDPPKPAPATRTFPRYTYRSPDKPVAGDRIAAERAFSDGVKDQQSRRLPEAIQAYKRAAQLDPAFYDAHYNLGLAASDSSNLPLALASYENALAIQPESLDARYNFGLALKQAGYVPDAIAQFDKILAKYPNDGRTHLALGNIYAQQLQDPAKAREHYLAVLAIAPQSPQAGAIRYWLSDHPK